MTPSHESWMTMAIAEAALARGTTGDNPWVGCVLISPAGELLGQGHTRGPGEDHAEIGALRQADAAGAPVEGATLYSTLEPCSFHGRTPACSRVVIERRIARVVFAMRDPNPRVDGEGARILRSAGIDVVEGVCEAQVRRQLGVWVVEFHPHEPRRRARALAAAHPPRDVASELASIYAIDPAVAETIGRAARQDADA